MNIIFFNLILVFSIVLGSYDGSKFEGIITNVIKEKGNYRDGKVHHSCHKVTIRADKFDMFNNSVSYCKFVKKYKNENDAKKFKSNLLQNSA